jgi:hypothetical protein
VKSIRLIIQITSVLGFVTAMGACGSDSGGGGASCSSVCSKVTAAHCESDPDCMTQCARAKDATPAGCMASYDALARCFSTAAFTCDEDGKSVAAACESQQTAWENCVNEGPADSGIGGAGSGGAGSGGKGSGGGSSSATCNGQKATTPCDVCLARSCCTQLTACEGDQDCVTLASCVQNCADDACVQACGDTASQEAVDAYNASIDCLNAKCNSACSGDDPAGGTNGTGGMNGGSGQSGIGAPGDGNTGFGSPTTPPNCLPVPSDVDGYCGDVKYKVIYDCPSGAPYKDCVYNTMDSSGIYCCGH